MAEITEARASLGCMPTTAETPSSSIRDAASSAACNRPKPALPTTILTGRSRMPPAALISAAASRAQASDEGAQIPAGPLKGISKPIFNSDIGATFIANVRALDICKKHAIVIISRPAR